MRLKEKLWYIFKKTLQILGGFFLLAIVLILGINLWINFSAKTKIFDVQNVPMCRVGIVLGASVLPNQVLSDVLKDRALTAVLLWQNQKIEKILVSGDNGSRYYNEVLPVKNFLMEQGVPEEKIVLDYAGFDTYDSMYRAKHIFLVEDMIVITQDFHLSRAVYLCEQVGLQCVGIIADRQTYQKADYFALREILAKVKAFFDVVLQSKPKFLGEVEGMGD